MNKELVKDILGWDVKNWSRPLRFWEQNISPGQGMKALELGAREGGLSLWLALNGVTTVCSDFGDVEQTASPLHEKHKVKHLISYEHIDATHIPYENEFDIIVFKSIIGGIGYGNNYERQQEVFRQIHKALKPGGKLLFAENLTASSLHKLMRAKFVKWGDSWRYLSLAEMNELLSGFSAYELKTTGFAAAFGRSEKQRSILASADVVLNKITPKSWKYIAYGVAIK